MGSMLDVGDQFNQVNINLIALGTESIRISEFITEYVRCFHHCPKDVKTFLLSLFKMTGNRNE
jgi:hypothetical protein